MKIGNPADKPLVVPAGPQGPSATQAAAKPAAAPGTQVALSSTAADLIAGGVTPEFDADKVARIAQAIQEGRFTVNAEAIADKLIANAQELLAKPSAG
jgi:negative regulator of flagellin synthesis FlgM